MGYNSTLIILNDGPNVKMAIRPTDAEKARDAALATVNELKTGIDTLVEWISNFCKGCGGPASECET